MHNLMKALPLAIFFFSGAAGAATLKNAGKTEALVTVEINGKEEVVKIRPGDTYDTQTTRAAFTLGANKPVSAGLDDHLQIDDGAIHFETKPADPVNKGVQE